MNYRLIPMERAHLPQAAELERQCFSDPWTEAQLAGELDNELLSLSAAVGEDGTVLGYAEVRVILDEGTLERIAVAPRYRRQGIAEALLDAYSTVRPGAPGLPHPGGAGGQRPRHRPL